MTSRPTAADLLATAVRIAQVDLLAEALTETGRDEEWTRLQDAARKGYWECSPEGLVVLTAKGRDLVEGVAA